MRLPSSATCVPILTTSVPFVDHPCPFAGHAAPFDDHTCPFAGHARLFVWRSVPGCSNSESRSETVPRSRRPSFRLLPFLPPRFPLPITSTRTPSKFASEIKPSTFKRAPAARVLTFKFSATVPAVPERSSTTSDASSVIPSSSTRGTSPWAPVSAQPFSAAPPDTLPTPTGGTVSPPWPQNRRRRARRTA